MLWLKAFHVFGDIAWFAGIFYLPRLFVYHADTHDAPGLARFLVMERRLYAMMSLGAGVALTCGILMILWVPAYLSMHWLHAKLVLVALLLVYHGYCRVLMRTFAAGGNTRSAKWYRVFNEVPALLLLGIVILAVVKPF